MIGGSVLVFVDIYNNSIEKAPMELVDNVATFHTEEGREYRASVMFELIGTNGTFLRGQVLNVIFTAQESDEISFYVTSAGAGLFVNGQKHESNLIFVEMPTLSIEREEQLRAQSYADAGGEGYVAEFLVE